MNDNIYTLEHSFSLEVFPPKKEDEFEHVYQVLDAMALVKPDFISVTYGAGGSNSKKTVEIASYIQNTLHIPAIAHLTCVGSKKEDIQKILAELQNVGVNHILALRGDRPRTMSDEQFFGRDFIHASDMMAFIREHSDIHIAGACYPEKHYEATSLDEDLNALKIKQDMGAEFFISQLFFDNRFYFHFADRAITKGITAPLCAGIMPITSSKQIETSISLSGSSVPKKLTDLIATYGDKPEEMRKAGIHFAIEQILNLKNNGVKHIHLYSMNKPKTTAEIVFAL